MTTTDRSHFLFSFLSGGLAGIVAKTSIAPFDRIKILYQTTKKPFTYKHAMQDALFICRTEGIRGLWRGNTATILQVFPFAAIQFAVFDFLKERFEPVMHTQSQRNLGNFLAGSLAGVVATFLTYPTEFVRTRMAIQRGDLARSTLLETIQRIHAKEGFKAFFRGMVPSFLGMIPYKGTGFLMFHLMKDKLKEHSPHLAHNKGFDFIFGSIAGLVSQFVSYPFDTVRKKMQVETVLLEQGAIHAKKSTLEWSRHILVYEGTRGLFKGVTVNMLKGPIANGMCFTAKNFLHQTMDRVYAV